MTPLGWTLLIVGIGLAVFVVAAAYVFAKLAGGTEPNDFGDTDPKP